MRGLIVFVMILLLVGCTTFLPFSQQDEREMEGLLQDYVHRWGDWDGIKAVYTKDRRGWIGFIWLNEAGTFAERVVVLAYIDDRWIVVEASD